MSRAKHSESLNAVQLFPFVAVLLCTMGSLLVLLVSVARSSKERAVAEAATAQASAIAAAPVDESLLKKIAQIQRQFDRLKSREGQANRQLKEEQLQLGHLEDHMRRLHEELDALRAAATELESLANSHFDNRKLAELELERLRGMLVERKQTMEALRKDRSKRRTYAVLPYTTDGGTRRPPIYFECTKQGILLQPEGIRFTAEDFRGPPGPGNPAAVAFRAAREQIVRQQAASGRNDEAEPYALIVVRPDGQGASQRLRQVLDKSGIDFGYEIVESEANLTYPPADPQLLAVQNQAVQTARGRLDVLARAAPQLYDVRNSASRNYGPEDEEEDADSEDEQSTVHIDSSGPREARRGVQLAIDSTANYPGGGGGVRVTPDSNSAAGKISGGTLYVASLPGGGSPERSGLNVPPGTSVRGGQGGQAEYSGTGGAGPGGSLPGAGPTEGPVYRDGLVAMQPGGSSPSLGSGQRSGMGGSDSSSASFGTSSGSGNGGGAASGGGNGTASGTGAGGNGSGGSGGGGSGSSDGAVGDRYASSPSGPPPEGATPQLISTNNGQSGTVAPAREPAQFGNYDPQAMPSSGIDQKLAPSGDSSGRPLPAVISNNAAGRHVDEADSDDDPPRKTKTKIRGKDWAISGRAPGAIPIRRTIHVVVRGDSLAIRREAGTDDIADIDREVPLIGQTRTARDDFADALEHHIRAWGMAGQGLYWRPVIALVVTPDGQDRADDLVEMLKNSGIELQPAEVAQNAEGENARASR